MDIRLYKTYMNIKTRSLYWVVGFSTDSETQETRVEYIRTYSPIHDYRKWSRPLSLFKAKFVEVDTSFTRNPPRPPRPSSKIPHILTKITKAK